MFVKENRILGRGLALASCFEFPSYMSQCYAWFDVRANMGSCATTLYLRRCPTYRWCERDSPGRMIRFSSDIMYELTSRFRETKESWAQGWSRESSAWLPACAPWFPDMYVFLRRCMYVGSFERTASKRMTFFDRCDMSMYTCLSYRPKLVFLLQKQVYDLSCLSITLINLITRITRLTLITLITLIHPNASGQCRALLCMFYVCQSWSPD